MEEWQKKKWYTWRDNRNTNPCMFYFNSDYATDKYDDLITKGGWTEIWEVEPEQEPEYRCKGAYADLYKASYLTIRRVYPESK